MSMKRMLINATQFDELRAAITDGAHLIDLDIEHRGQQQKISNIYKGIITSIEPSLGAVFVDYGAERHGFLPLKEISREYFLDRGDHQSDFESSDIKALLKEGQPLVVQVEKEERGGKGAALTTFISLAGSYLVLMPNNPRAGGISRRIEGEERDQLREALSQLNIPEGMGVIVRTAGVGKNKEELAWDLSVLLRYWEAIKKAATLKQGAYLIHQESDVIIRAIRDYLRQDIQEIIVDEEDAYQRAFNYLNQVRPDFTARLKLYKDTLPLFSRFQIEQQIENAHLREVRLPSGGSIVIDNTEALVSIDINSARATKGGNIEETALNTNLEAAEEIARQLRIRDVGGLIVIDFIDMTPVRNQREVESCLRNALRQDRARIQVGRISRFGLLEMSRQRLRSSLSLTSQITCPRCSGQGTIRSVESQASSIIHLIQEQASKSNNIHFQVQLPLDVSTYIVNEKRTALKEIESHCEVKITIIPNQHLESPQYHLKQIKCDLASLEFNKSTPSYRIAKTINTESTARKAPSRIHEPAVNQFLTSTPPSSETPSTRKPSSNGLIKRLWSKMFGPDEQNTTTKKAKTPPRKRQDKPSGTGRKASTRQQRPSANRQPRKSGQGQGGAKNRTRRGSRGGQQRRGTGTSPNKNISAHKSRAHTKKPADRQAPANKQHKTQKRTDKPRTENQPPMPPTVAGTPQAQQRTQHHEKNQQPTKPPIQQDTAKKANEQQRHGHQQKPTAVSPQQPPTHHETKKPDSSHTRTSEDIDKKDDK